MSQTAEAESQVSQCVMERLHKINSLLIFTKSGFKSGNIRFEIFPDPQRNFRVSLCKHIFIFTADLRINIFKKTNKTIWKKARELVHVSGPDRSSFRWTAGLWLKAASTHSASEGTGHTTMLVSLLLDDFYKTKNHLQFDTNCPENTFPTDTGDKVTGLRETSLLRIKSGSEMWTLSQSNKAAVWKQ